MKIFMDTQGEAKYYYETAYFGWQNETQAFIGIREGYKNAADILVDYILKENSEKDREQIIFPILFNYRHSIETLLKSIYYRATGKLCKGGHDLLRLWRNIKKDIISGILKNESIKTEIKKVNPLFCAPNVSDIQIEKIEAMLKELQGANRRSADRTECQQNDAKADVWRYLISNDGKLYFKKGHWVHYPTLKKSINELYDMLDNLYKVVDRFLSGEECNVTID